MSKPGKVGSIEEAMSLIEHKIGRGKVLFANQLYSSNATRVPSGSLLLDAAMGGGFVPGALHIFWGDMSSGKTTAAYQAIAMFQKTFPDKYPFLVVTEQFDAMNAEMNGIDLSRLILVFSDTAEQGFNAAEVLVRTRLVSLFVIDSVDGLIPRAELEGAMEDNQRGLQARMINKALRKLYSAMQPVYDEKTKQVSYATGTTALFISQMRVNQNASVFQSTEMRGGGKGLDHAAKMIIRFGAKTKGGMITKEIQGKEIPVGVRKKTETVKNNTYPPNQTSSFDYYFAPHTSTKFGKKRVFGPGFIDHSREIIELAFEYGTLKGDPKNGFVYEGEKYRQHAFEHLLDESPKVAYSLLKDTLTKIQPALPSSLAKFYALRLKRMRTYRREKLGVSSPPRTASKPVRLGRKRKTEKSSSGK